MQTEKVRNSSIAVKYDPFLQPCDRSVNSSFKKGIWRYRDLFHKQTTLYMRSVRSNLIVVVLGYSEITVEKIKSSLEKTGAWPINYSFLHNFKEKRLRTCTNNPDCSEKESKMMQTEPGTIGFFATFGTLWQLPLTRRQDWEMWKYFWARTRVLIKFSWLARGFQTVFLGIQVVKKASSCRKGHQRCTWLWAMCRPGRQKTHGVLLKRYVRWRRKHTVNENWSSYKLRRLPLVASRDQNWWSQIHPLLQPFSVLLLTTSTAKYGATMSSTLSNQAFWKDPRGEIEVADSLLSLSRR